MIYLGFFVFVFHHPVSELNGNMGTTAPEYFKPLMVVLISTIPSEILLCWPEKRGMGIVKRASTLFFLAQWLLF